MKKIIVFLLLPVLALTGCLETEQTTTINADGSGNYSATIDMGKLMQFYKMSASMKKAEDSNAKEEPPLVRDTLIYFRNYSDTATSFTNKEKELLREMTLAVNIDSENEVFTVKISSPFKKLSDFDQLTKLTGRKEFDHVFDKAMELPGLTDEKKDEPAVPGKMENDNIFDLIAPDIYQCKYEPGNISCKLNPVKYQAVLKNIKKTGMSLTDRQNREMMTAMKITSRYVLPNKPKSITGITLKKDGANMVVQTGNLYDLYKNPKKYEYTIKY